jgi:hypothetical protein
MYRWTRILYFGVHFILNLHALQISEPEQWGLASVKNKRLVYFYGTKQM